VREITKRVAAVVLLGAVGVLSAACSSSAGHKAQSDPARFGATPTVIPTSNGGGPGTGPIVGSNTSGPIALPDRSVAIVSFTKRFQKRNQAEFVDISLTISNQGQSPISNEPRFFSLVGQGGDVFSYQDNSSDNFYLPIDPHTSRTGLIEFEIPAAAAKSLQLLYRPDVATDTVIARLVPS
jgi:uncharacterized protein DUF4352